jgi:very-short-patch-repair endonuclease
VRSLHANDRAIQSGIPVTSVARALLDYAEHTSFQRLRTALETAERQDLLDGRALDDLLSRATGRRGLPSLKRAIALLAPEPPWTQSERERRFLELVRAAGLPEPSATVMVHDELVDFYWAQARLVVEVDSYHFHKGPREFENDRRRDAKLQLAGERVLRYTQHRLKYEPQQVIAELNGVDRLTGLA